MDKILILQLASILQSIAICFLCVCIINLRKMLCGFIEDEFSRNYDSLGSQFRMYQKFG